MKYDPDIHHRRSIRLKDYDYSQPGAYFITILTRRRKCLFGEIIDGTMKANDASLLAQNEWKRLAIRFPEMYTDDFVVMPDHIHAIIVLEPVNEKSPRLGTIIGAYKSTVARLINGLCHTTGAQSGSETITNISFVTKKIS